MRIKKKRKKRSHTTKMPHETLTTENYYKSCKFHYGSMYCYFPTSFAERSICYNYGLITFSKTWRNQGVDCRLAIPTPSVLLSSLQERQPEITTNGRLFSDELSPQPMKLKFKGYYLSPL